MPALVLIGGLLIYAYLSICYDRFYMSLRVDPNDVGLTYAGTLGRSTGFVTAYLLFTLYISSAVVSSALFTRVMVQYSESRTRRRGSWLQPLRSMPKPFAGTVLTGVMLISLIVPLSAAGDAARDVRLGKAVDPIAFTPFPWWPQLKVPIPVLAIHADPAMVEPAGKPGESPAAERLRGRRLLYLGQAGGTVVFYDAAAQRAVYVPSSAVILHVANCRGNPPPDPAC